MSLSFNGPSEAFGGKLSTSDRDLSNKENENKPASPKEEVERFAGIIRSCLATRQSSLNLSYLQESVLPEIDRAHNLQEAQGHLRSWIEDSQIPSSLKPICKEICAAVHQVFPSLQAMDPTLLETSSQQTTFPSEGHEAVPSHAWRRQYPMGSLNERMDRKTPLFQDKNVLSVAAQVSNDDGAALAAITNDGKAVMQQRSISGGSLAVVTAMLLIDGEKPIPSRLHEQMANHRLRYSKEELAQMLGQLQDQGVEAKIEQSPNSLTKLAQSIEAFGPAIVALDPTSSIRDPIRAVIVDSISEGGLRVNLRDPYHGWAISVKAEAFKAIWDQSLPILLTRSTSSFSVAATVPEIPRERLLGTKNATALQGLRENGRLEGHSDRQLALEFAKNGALGQLLWMVENRWVTPDELRTAHRAGEETLSIENQQWLELQLTFAATSALSLDRLALNQDRGFGLGYKSANLIHLQSLAAQASKACVGCEVQVPSFFPFGDTQMQAFLRQGYPNLDQDWQAFIGCFSLSDRQAFLEGRGSLTLSKEASAKFEEIRKKITDQFKPPQSFMTPQLQTWLDKENPTFLIIRSTGKEDSATNSNAGGNASIPFIAPNAEAISSAIGQVLASYFGEKSILQRLSARDTSLLTEPPFMPVLVQDMVTENIGGISTPREQVPRSGVMFTRAEGQAQGLTELYVGLGNNEGVVSSRVNTDRYQIDSHYSVATAVHNKDTRFVAVESGGHYTCEAVKNKDPLLARSPALPLGVAIDMKHVADYFSQAYAQLDTPASLDMEFSVQMGPHDTKPTIYLLQARPLAKMPASHPPSYIDAKYLDTQDKVEAQTLAAAGAYVRVIRNPSQVIVADTITEALAIYLHAEAQGLDTSTIKTILIRKPAPGTSHEAITFQSRGIGILIIEDAARFQKAQKMIEQAQVNPICLDMQRGLVLHEPQDTLAICQGYTCYPMALEYSMHASPLICQMREAFLEANEKQRPVKIDDETSKHYELFMKRLEALIKPAGAKKAGRTLRELLEIMGEGSPEEAKLAAAQTLRILKNILFNKELNTPALSHLEWVMIVENVMDVIEHQLLPAADEPAKSLERLYPVRLLEACLFQQEGNAYGAFSLTSCLTAIRNQHQALTEAQELFKVTTDIEQQLSLTPLLLLNKTLLKSALSDKWKSVLRQMGTVAQGDIQLICEYIRNINELGSLTEWSNTHLPKVFKELNIKAIEDITPDLAGRVFNELATLARESSESIQQLKAMKTQLQNVHQSMQAWATPGHGQKHASSLVARFQAMGFEVTDSSEDENRKVSGLLATYEQCPESLRLVYLHIVLEAVRTYDEVIKTCKGSAQYSSFQQQATDVQLLISPYKKMMEAIVWLCDKQGALQDRKDNFLTDHCSKLENGFFYHLLTIYKKTPGFKNIRVTANEQACKRLLIPSADFHVSAFNLGSRQDFTYGVVWPETFEDYFTCFHQLSESAINLLKIKAGFSENIFDERLNYLVKYLRERVIMPRDDLIIHFLTDENGTYILDEKGEKVPMSDDDYVRKQRGRLSKITTDGPLVEVVLDIPMRQHAARMKLLYDRSNPSKVVIHMDMFGVNEDARWDLTAAAVSLLGSDMAELTLREVTCNDSSSQQVHFELVMHNDQAFLPLAVFLPKIFEITSNTSQAVCMDYIEAANLLRKSLNHRSIDPTTVNLEQGAFFLMPAMIDKAIKNGKQALAKLLIDRLESFLEAHPDLKKKEHPNGWISYPAQTSYKQIEEAMNKATRLGSALKVLKENYAKKFSAAAAASAT